MEINAAIIPCDSDIGIQWNRPGSSRLFRLVVLLSAPFSLILRSESRRITSAIFLITFAVTSEPASWKHRTTSALRSVSPLIATFNNVASGRNEIEGYQLGPTRRCRHPIFAQHSAEPRPPEHLKPYRFVVAVNQT